MRFHKLLGAVERKLLGAAMTAIAFILDRRLRALQARAADESDIGIKVRVDI
jgi:hypothetical protein